MAPTPDPKNHHFIPKFLLREFADKDGRVYYVHRKSKLDYPVKKLVDDIFSGHRLNSLTSNDGTFDNSTEHELAEIDSLASEVLRYMKSTLELGKTPSLSFEQRHIWDVFICILHKRSPILKRKIATKQFIDEQLEDSIDWLEKARGPIPSNIREKIASEDWRKNALKYASVKSTTKLGEDVIAALAAKGLCFAKIVKSTKSFIIGDIPFLRMGDGISSELSKPTTELWLPITPTIAVSPFGRRGNDVTVELTDIAIRKINACIWQQSEGAASTSSQLLVSLMNSR